MLDALVVGLGATGAATLYQLARRGASVLGIDRHAPPHDLGSSHGESRITRLGCGEGAVFTPFARRSHEIWRQIEAETGETLLTQNGLLVISGEGPRAERPGTSDFLVTSIMAGKAGGVPHNVLDGGSVRRCFPAFAAIGDSDQAYYERGAGYLRPERCISAQLALAQRHGATIQTGETVLSFEEADGGVTVTTDRGHHRAKQIILAAGPWLSALAGPAFAAKLTVRRQVLFWFGLRGDANPADYTPERMPVFIWQVPAPQPIYGFPAVDGPAQGVKIATEQTMEACDADAVDRTVSADEGSAMHETYVAPYFPGLAPTPLRATVCLYTCTDDARFVIDRVPGFSRVVAASPCSGHGFKHSAAIGEALAMEALGEPPALDLAPLRLGAGPSRA